MSLSNVPVAADFATGLDTFMHLVNGVARCIEGGRLPEAESADPAERAVELWALNHGVVGLQLAPMLPSEQARARRRLVQVARRP